MEFPTFQLAMELIDEKKSLGQKPGDTVHLKLLVTSFITDNNNLFDKFRCAIIFCNISRIKKYKTVYVLLYICIKTYHFPVEQTWNVCYLF